MSTDRLTSQMRGLDISKPATSSSSSQHPQQQPRLAPVLKKYMNPALAASRPPNQGPSIYAEQQASGSAAMRGPLLKLAGINVDRLAPTHGSSSPSGKKPVAHTAHGVHGPAHATSSRIMTSTVPSQAPKKVPVVNVNDMPIGKYDGGLEREEREIVRMQGGREVADYTGKILDVDSGNKTIGDKK
jgi:aurora kinase